jgi:hypothetical protein
MKHKRNWIIGIALSATATFVALQTVSAPTQESVPTTETAIPVTETATLAYEGCAYTWAYHNAPELTGKLDSAVKELNPDANATATLFGEDCIRADGSITFGVMETDFSVKLPVDDLTQHEEFGIWIKDVMQIVTEIPQEEIQGNYGFVEFWFEKDELEHIVFRVSIPAYLNEAGDKTGEELFNLYYNP